MEIKINRKISEPPKRDYSIRNSDEVRADRDAANKALRSLRVGQSAVFTGGVSRDRVNSYIASLARAGYPRSFTTAKTSDGLGVWRVG